MMVWWGSGWGAVVRTWPVLNMALPKMAGAILEMSEPGSTMAGSLPPAARHE